MGVKSSGDGNIKQAIKNYITDIAKYMAQDIADDMIKTAKTAIAIFYNSYDPEDINSHNGHIYYYRHWNFERKSFKRYYSNHNPIFTGGIELTMFDFPNVYSGTNSAPQNVFWRVYSGYHGIASFQSAKNETRIDVPIMRPSPIEMIHDKYDYIKKNLKEYEERARRKAQR